MSYCRLSSLGGRCDVYVYESAQGWELIVASNRKFGPIAHVRVYSQSTNRIQEYIDGREFETRVNFNLPYVPLDHPEAGRDYTFQSPGECADKLEELQGDFVIPQSAIDSLREEQKEMDEDGTAV